MAERSLTQRNEIGVRVCIVLAAPVIVDDVLAEHLAQLGIRLRPVRAECVEQGNVAAHNAGGFQFRQQNRQQSVVRCGTSDVGVNDDNFVTGARFGRERCGVDWLA